jgi:hypothetical protein
VRRRVTIGSWRRATARLLILLSLLSTALVAPAAAAAANYGGWEEGHAIMCGPATNQLVVNVGGSNYRCGFRYDPPYHTGLYEPGWGWVGLCPSFPPYGGYCWAWRQ